MEALIFSGKYAADGDLDYSFSRVHTLIIRIIDRTFACFEYSSAK